MMLEHYGLDRATVEQMYEEWKSGEHSKSAIERRYLGKSTHNGKLFSKLVKDCLDIDTVTASSTHRELERLRSLLEAHDIDPKTGVAAVRLPLPEMEQ
ncbi:MAG: hypothetical protein OXL98_06090 [Acidimicrobiaceae bacterium]|nr:hypothetical protein [Acidimicrobiaceae bacterium]